MALVTCPGCGRQLRVSSLGRKVRCPRPDCKTVFVAGEAPAQPTGVGSTPSAVPVSDTGAADEPVPDILAGVPDDLLAAAQPMPGVQPLPTAGAGKLPGRPGTKKKSSNMPMIAAVAGGVVGLVLLVVVILVLVLSGGESSARPGPAVTVPEQPAPAPPRPPASQPAPPPPTTAQQAPAQPSASQAQQAPAALNVDPVRFALPDADAIVRVAIARLPQEAIWYEEFHAAIRPVLMAVEPYIGSVVDLVAVRKNDQVLYVFRCGQAIDANRLVSSWQARPVAEVAGIRFYALPTSPQRIAFPDPATMLVGPEDLLRQSLEHAASAASQALHPLLAKAGIQQGNELPVFAVVPSDWMRNQLTKALAFVVERQQEELRDAMQRPHTTALVLVPESTNSTYVDLYFQCESRGEADVFARWMGGLPDFARRLQESVSRESNQRRPAPPSTKNAEEGEVVSDPARHRRSQIAGAVAALAGIWRDADVQQQDELVRIRTKIPTNEDWITNRVELLTATIGAALGTDAVGVWPYYGPLIRTGIGINAYLRAHDQTFPQGTIPTKQETQWKFLRMSWMVHILPYIGRQHLYDSLDLKSSWTSPTNVRAALTIVDEFLDPKVPVRRGEDGPYLGLALTHFVGMAGVGVDAPTLPANHPRAGVFAYDRVTRVADIKDGTGQTIMLIEAYDIFGPWVAGGGATIRAAQRPPYIGTIGGFGSPGEPPGVFVLMADGSARYISKNIDNKVFEALCTIAGSETVTLEQQGTLPNGLPIITGKREEQ